MLIIYDGKLYSHVISCCGLEAVLLHCSTLGNVCTTCRRMERNLKVREELKMRGQIEREVHERRMEREKKKRG